jgi:RNA polymerase sigma-70 factor (ECF subfamily)
MKLAFLFGHSEKTRRVENFVNHVQDFCFACDNVSSMEHSDEQLIAATLAGDDRAFPELVSRYMQPLYNFIYRLCGSASDAEDIAQEVFVKVWKNLTKYRQGESVRAWIFTIARNTTIDWLRKKKHLVFSDFENAEGENLLVATLADTELLADELYARGEDHEALEAALAALPLLQREVLLLHYREGLTFDEIGRTLDVPLHTVKSRHHRALLRLRELFRISEP